MTGQTHRLIAVTAAGAFCQATHLDAFGHVVVMGTAFTTAKLPDWDLRLGIRHRTVTHYLATMVVLAAALCALISFTLGFPIAVLPVLGFLLGYGSHLLADACTIAGVPLAGPFWKEDVHLLPGPLRIRTGGSVESLGAVVLLGADALYAWTTLGGGLA